ncbi:MAG TPA: hypothetical protein VIV60_24010, partial [Polyangiaceae bacterium]
MAHRGPLRVVYALGIVSLCQTSAAADSSTIDYDAHNEPNRTLHYRLDPIDPQRDVERYGENHDQDDSAAIALRHGLLSPFTLSPVV